VHRACRRGRPDSGQQADGSALGRHPVAILALASRTDRTLRECDRWTLERLVQTCGELCPVSIFVSDDLGVSWAGASSAETLFPRSSQLTWHFLVQVTVLAVTERAFRAGTSGDPDRIMQMGVPALRGDHEENRQVNAGLGTGTRGSGDLGIERGLGHLAQMASQAGEPVEVGRQRPVEVSGVPLGDLVLGEVLTGALLRCAFPWCAESASRCLAYSHGEGEVVKGDAEPVTVRGLGRDVVVAAAQVLDEGMSRGEDPG
jgi:hypothetical protein